eukprot:COSAG05_NODE_204_length_14187_cov_99.887422_20_plen_83_part_00
MYYRVMPLLVQVAVTKKRRVGTDASTAGPARNPVADQQQANGNIRITSASSAAAQPTTLVEEANAVMDLVSTTGIPRSIRLP